MSPLREDLSRRHFLVTSVVVAGAATLLAAEPHLDFPAKPRDRLAVTSWPFRAYMEAPGNHDRDRSKPGMDAKDFAAMAVERFDIHNTERGCRHQLNRIMVANTRHSRGADPHSRISCHSTSW